MPDFPVDSVVTIIVALLASGGFWSFLQSRQSKRLGVKEQDVAAQKNSGDLALELIRELRKQISDLEDDRDDDRKRMTALEKDNARLSRDVAEFRAAVQDATHALDELIAWEAAGSPPPPPHRLTTIYARLKRTISKETPE